MQKLQCLIITSKPCCTVVESVESMLQWYKSKLLNISSSERSLVLWLHCVLSFRELVVGGKQLCTVHKLSASCDNTCSDLVVSIELASKCKPPNHPKVMNDHGWPRHKRNTCFGNDSLKIKETKNLGGIGWCWIVLNQWKSDWCNWSF